MDPLFAARLASVLGKLIGLETAADKVSSGELTGTSIASLLRQVLDLWGETGDPSKKSSMAALQCGLITHCFGHALRRQGESGDSLAARTWTWFRPREERQQEQEIQRRMERVLKPLWHLGDIQSSALELKMLESLSGSPLLNDYFQNLWKEFVLEPFEENDSRLIELKNGSRLKFEHHFLLEYWQCLVSPEGRSLEQYLSQTSVGYKTLLIRDMIIRDMSIWGERHVFGSVTKDKYSNSDSADSIPFMSLDEMYVEPNVVKSRDSECAPVIGEIERQLFKLNNTVLVVKADFGMGKTITARKLAQHLALRFLDADQSSPRLWAPIFIRCSSDMVMKGNEFNLERAVRSAQRQHVNEILKSKYLKESDSALQPPPDEEKTLFLLDGLDEVALEESAQEQFFHQIEAEATERHRFIIFSRPGSILSEHIPPGTPVLEISPWQEPQIRDWLSRWRKLNGGQGPSFEELNARALDELSVTPILLFMIAHTWKPLVEGKQQSSASVYEAFFQNIARGKHRAGGEAHGVVLRASQKLKQLESLEPLSSSEGPEAMLRLMGCIAWEWTRREHAVKFKLSKSAAPLTRGDIEALLKKELGIQGDQAFKILKPVQDGLLLAMQVQFDTKGTSRFLFGHKSFREFLVARYWADRLKALTREPRQWEELESSLLGGRLLSREERTFEVLMELLNANPTDPESALGLTDEERGRVLAWAQHCFTSETPTSKSSPVSLREDWHPLLREAALAIASRLQGSPGVKVQDELTLRSMFTWFWLKRLGPIVIAPRARLERSILAELNLRGADFRNADLTEANLSSSSMLSRRDDPSQRCDFSEAILERAQLTRANMQQAVFTKARLKDADCSYTHLMHTHFVDADLRSANLEGASLEGANLERANLKGAKLQGAILKGANLEGADLERADLEGVNLEGADLEGVNLEGADLEGAILEWTNLKGANLEWANLEWANLEGAGYNARTRWPTGFDPQAAGARQVLEEE